LTTKLLNMLNAQSGQSSQQHDANSNAHPHEAATSLATVTQPPLNMAGIPICLSSFSKPILEHFVFSSKVFDKFAISHTKWVIDTGAIDHMVITTQFYTSMQVVHNLSVNFPNG
jgi:hypothetical protein